MWCRLVCVLLVAAAAVCIATEPVDSSTADPIPSSGIDASTDRVPSSLWAGSARDLIETDTSPDACFACCSDPKVDEILQLLAATFERLQAQEATLDALRTAVARARYPTPDPELH